MVYLKNLLICTASMTLLSCAMKRHGGSGYAGSSQNSSSSSRGWGNSRSGSNTSAKASLSDSKNLKNMESDLSSQQEIKQYYHYKALLKTDEKRIAFLQQPNMAAKNAWLKSSLFPITKKDFNPKEVEMISKRDITVGMSKYAVEESWGNPLEKKAAGKQIRGNELWIYKKMVPTSNGYKTEVRHVYFEAGHVAGWETKK